MTRVRPLALAIVGACLMPGSLAGDEIMSVKVSPRVAVDPAVVLVSAVVASDESNRALVVTAESSDYYRSSQMPLDGVRAPRVNVVRLADLPPGLYDVSVALMGREGLRAEASGSVRVVGFR